MKITVLGANGFVGSALTQYFQTNDIEVVSLGRPHFDLTEPRTLSQIPADTDIIIHSAGHVGSALKDEIIWNTNVKSTYDLVQYLNNHKYLNLKLMIYLSSGAVYGLQDDVLTCNSPLHPDSLYGVSKLLAEQIIEKVFQGRAVFLRLFFPFGSGQRLPRLFPILIRRVHREEEIEIDNAGGPFVNPIFIDDLLYQIMQIIRKPDKAYYNLGGSEVLSIKHIAEIIGQYLDKKPCFRINEKKKGNILCNPDLTIAQSCFKEQLITMINNADYL